MNIRQILREEIQKVTKVIINESQLNSKEQQVLNDILGSGGLNEENNFSTILQKVKQYAVKGLITAGILASLLSSKGFSQEQKQQIKQVSQITNDVQQNQTQGINITPEDEADWNNFIDWIGNTYEPISDKGADPTSNLTKEYHKVNPRTKINVNTVKDFQQALMDYNKKWITLQKNYHPQGNTLSKPSPNDGRIGSITSKEKFPEVSYIINGKRIDFGTDIDRAVKEINAERNRLNQIYIDPNLTPEQRLEKNNQLRSQGKPLPTVGDMENMRQQKVSPQMVNNDNI